MDATKAAFDRPLISIQIDALFKVGYIRCSIRLFVFSFVHPILSI